MEEFKERQRAMWGAGDYVTLSDYITDIGERVVERVGVAPGMRALDVACGTGNAAIPAARAGAEVTGLDLAPKLLEGGRRKAEAAGVEVEWIEGDAEELPFEDDRFDRVFSTIGHMFAPRHRRTADEMSRVCRPGGVIATCNWTPEGTVGDVFAATGEFMPPPPDFVEPPILWGTEEHFREMFEGAKEFEFERHVNTVEWPAGTEDWTGYFAERFGPLVTAKQMLGDEFDRLRQRLEEIFERRNEADDGSLRLPQEYLLAIARF
jgi:SAM-dependent methyltransferase